MKTQVSRNLTYRVEIARDEGEDWASYEDRGNQYDIRIVTVDVDVDNNGVFSASWHPRIIEGWRIKKDGTTGKQSIGHSTYWGNTPEMIEQRDKFKEEALRAARAMHLATR